MRKNKGIAGLITVFMVVAFVAIAVEKPVALETSNKMPDQVKTIVDNKCFGCHNTDSRNEKAKEELDFNKLADLSKVKMMGAFNHIKEVLEEGSMPPEKFLEKRPEKALTNEEKEILTEWVEKEIAGVLKKE